MKIPAALFLRIIIGEELFSDDEEIQVFGEKSVCISSMVAGLAFGRLLRNGQIHTRFFRYIFVVRPCLYYQKVGCMGIRSVKRMQPATWEFRS